MNFKQYMSEDVKLAGATLTTKDKSSTIKIGAVSKKVGDKIMWPVTVTKKGGKPETRDMDEKDITLACDIVPKSG